MKQVMESPEPSTRRRFLTGVAVAAGAAAAVGAKAPAVVGQTPITMRWQSTWPSKDIFHEYANDFAKKPRPSRQALAGRRSWPWPPHCIEPA